MDFIVECPNTLGRLIDEEQLVPVLQKILLSEEEGEVASSSRGPELDQVTNGHSTVVKKRKKWKRNLKPKIDPDQYQKEYDAEKKRQAEELQRKVDSEAVASASSSDFEEIQRMYVDEMEPTTEEVSEQSSNEDGVASPGREESSGEEEDEETRSKNLKTMNTHCEKTYRNLHKNGMTSSICSRNARRSTAAYISSKITQ